MWHFYCVKGILVSGKHVQMGILLDFLYCCWTRRSIKLYMTSYDVSQWSVATSFHSTLAFNTLRKYVQTIIIHHWKLFYVERQTAKRHNYSQYLRYRWNACGLTSGSSFIEENDIAIGPSSSLMCTSSPSIFIMTSLVSTADRTLVSLHKSCSTLGTSVQLCKTNVFLSVMCALWPPPQKNYAGKSQFMPLLCTWKRPLDQT